MRLITFKRLQMKSLVSQTLFLSLFGQLDAKTTLNIFLFRMSIFFAMLKIWISSKNKRLHGESANRGLMIYMLNMKDLNLNLAAIQKLSSGD